MSVGIRNRRRFVAFVALLLAIAQRGAAAEVIPLEAFGSLPQTQHASVSPNGRLLAFDDLRDGKSRVVVYDIDAQQTPRVVDSDPGNTLRDLTWADDETLLVEVSIPRQTDCGTGRRCTVEWFRHLAVRMDGSPPRMLLNDQGNRRNVTGAHLLATHTARPGTVTLSTLDFSDLREHQTVGSRLRQSEKDLTGWASVVYEVETRTGKSRILATGTQYTQQWLVDAQGQPVARSDWDARRQVYTVVARQGQSWHEIWRRDGHNELNLAGLDLDGKNIVAFGADGGDYIRAWLLPLDGSAASVLEADAKDDVDWYDFDWNRNAVIAVGRSASSARWFDPKMDARLRTVGRTFPDRRISIVGRSANGERVVVKVQSPSVPPVYRIVDFAHARADIIAEAYPGLTRARLGEVRSIDYVARDGIRVPAYLTLPAGSTGKSLPLVVLPHGDRNVGDTDDFDDFNWMSQFLASRGYAVLRPKFRGSTGHGEALRAAGDRQWGGLMQDDVTDGVKHLVSEGVADPKRVCIAGFGYGGYAALAGAAFTPELYKCAASVNGISDLPDFMGGIKLDDYSNTEEALAYLVQSIGSVTDPKVAARSPARFASNFVAPVLLIHGIDDSVVPVKQSEAMWRALDKLGKPVTFVRLEGEDHWLSRSASRTRVLQELEAFLAKNLQ